MRLKGLIISIFIFNIIFLATSSLALRDCGECNGAYCTSGGKGYNCNGASMVGEFGTCNARCGCEYGCLIDCGAGCENNADCAPGSTCDYATCRCTTPPPTPKSLHESCTSTSECVDGLECVNTGSGSTTCENTMCEPGVDVTPCGTCGTKQCVNGGTSWGSCSEPAACASSLCDSDPCNGCVYQCTIPPACASSEVECPANSGNCVAQCPGGCDGDPCNGCNSCSGSTADPGQATCSPSNSWIPYPGGGSCSGCPQGANCVAEAWCDASGRTIARWGDATYWQCVNGAGGPGACNPCTAASGDPDCVSGCCTDPNGCTIQCKPRIDSITPFINVIASPSSKATNLIISGVCLVPTTSFYNTGNNRVTVENPNIYGTSYYGINNGGPIAGFDDIYGVTSVMDPTRGWSRNRSTYGSGTNGLADVLEAHNPSAGFHAIVNPARTRMTLKLPGSDPEIFNVPGWKSVTTYAARTYPNTNNWNEQVSRPIDFHVGCRTSRVPSGGYAEQCCGDEGDSDFGTDWWDGLIYSPPTTYQTDYLCDIEENWALHKGRLGLYSAQEYAGMIAYTEDALDFNGIVSDGSYDMVSDGHSWYFCDSNNDGAAHGPNGIKFSDSLTLWGYNFGFGADNIGTILGHDYMCTTDGATEAVAECCGISGANCNDNDYPGPYGGQKYTVDQEVVQQTATTGSIRYCCTSEGRWDLGECYENCAALGDEDKNGECDWDDSTPGCTKGDATCPVRANILSVSDLLPAPGSLITVDVRVLAGTYRVDSVYAYVDQNSNGNYDCGESRCNAAPYVWLDAYSTIRFTCNVGAAGLKKIGAEIYNGEACEADRSYENGVADSTIQVAVGGGVVCNTLLDKATCDGSTLPDCKWITDCSGTSSIPPRVNKKGTGYAASGLCVPQADIIPENCKKTCGDTCDLGDFSACSPTTQCVGNRIQRTNVWCDATCGCQNDGYVWDTCANSGPCAPQCTVNGCNGVSGTTCNLTTCRWEAAPAEGTAFGNCRDNSDNDCDGLYDGQDPGCPEGSGSLLAYRACTDNINNDLDNWQDSNDDGCCDFCTGPGKVFDTTGGPFRNGGSLALCTGQNLAYWDPTLTGTPNGRRCCDQANNEYNVSKGNYGPGCCTNNAQCVGINQITNALSCHSGFEGPAYVNTCNAAGDDEDCDSTCNYDSQVCKNLNGVPRPGKWAEPECTVSLIDMWTSVAGSCPRSVIQAYCQINPLNGGGSIDSVEATIYNSSNGKWTQCAWNATNGNIYEFNCTLSGTPSAINLINCTINNSKSYQTGLNFTRQVQEGECDPIALASENYCHPTLSNKRCNAATCTYNDVYEDTFPLCTNGIDDDCDRPTPWLIDAQEPDCYGVEIKGTVYKADQPGWVLEKVTVKTSPPGLNTTYELTNTTNFKGEYWIAKPFVGEYLVRARKPGYTDDIRTVLIESSRTKIIPTTLDFYMYEGLTCNEHCQDQNGNCNLACNGTIFNKTDALGNIYQANCTFTDQKCTGKPKDYKVTYTDNNPQPGTYHEITCCEGPTTTRKTLNATVQGPVETIADYITPLKRDGQLLKMHILVWSK